MRPVAQADLKPKGTTEVASKHLAPHRGTEADMVENRLPQTPRQQKHGKTLSSSYLDAALGQHNGHTTRQRAHPARAPATGTGNGQSWP